MPVVPPAPRVPHLQASRLGGTALLGNLSNPYRVPARLLIFGAYPATLPVAGHRLLGHTEWLVAERMSRRTLGFALFRRHSQFARPSMIALGRPMPFQSTNVLNDFRRRPAARLPTRTRSGGNFPVVSGLALESMAAGHAPHRFVASRCSFASLSRRSQDAGSFDEVRRTRRRSFCSATCAIAYAVIAALGLRFFYDRYVLFLLLAAVLLF
jgi:hypothetical protein